MDLSRIPDNTFASTSTSAGAMPVGGARAVLEASVAALQRGTAATLAVVLETSGSTYVRAGALALFDGEGTQVGWLSGGCLEPEIAQRADDASRAGQVDFMEIDTRFDEDLLSGSAVGCRGRLRIALLPLALLGAKANRCGSASMTTARSNSRTRRTKARIGCRPQRPRGPTRNRAGRSPCRRHPR